MSRIFASSDTHFGHQNIIRYANRPFADWRAMGESLIKRWNARVGETDTVYFLGDFAMGPGATTEYTVQVLNRLNGFKSIVLGNHDQPSKYGDGLKAIIKQHDFDNVMVLDEQILNTKIDGKDFVMCHFPILEWEGKHHGAIHLHGHTHTEFPSDGKCQYDLSLRLEREKSYDIGVDMYGGPVQITGDLRYLNDPKGWGVSTPPSSTIWPRDIDGPIWPRT